MDEEYSRLLNRLYPLHRTLISDGTDRAIKMIMDFLKGMGVADENIITHEFPSGSEVSTWIVPKKYILNKFKLVQLGKEEKTIVDSSSDTPLSVAEYSQPVNKTVEWDEIKDHLYFSEKRPEAIPFVFKFFYRPNYGFCIKRSAFEKLEKNAKFKALIDSEFVDGVLKCLEVVIPGRTKKSILLMSNICHPYQVNDSITGVINNLMLIKHFLKKKNNHTLRFGFWPETIGAHAYFSKHINKKSIFEFALFTEMLGNNGKHSLQFSRQETSLIDRVAVYALKQQKLDFNTGRYTTVIRNDERVSNGANLDIPTISLSRWPYQEYHTSDDNPSIISMDNVRESSEITRHIIEIIDNNKTLIPQDFFGQPFLTRFGLFRDQKRGLPEKNLNKIMEDIFSYSDGETSLFDIAEKFGYPWETVRELSAGLLGKKLFSVKNENKGNDKFKIGVDCIDIARFNKKVLLNRNLMEKIFTCEEMEYCEKKANPPQHFAVRFAGKEAVIKTLSGEKKPGFNEIEILNDKSGAPFVRIGGKECLNIKISFAHCDNMAIASVLRVTDKI
jgi:phosphopantetheine--protein transferase-like protein